MRFRVQGPPLGLRELYVNAYTVNGDALGQLLSSPSLEAFRVRVRSVVGGLRCRPRPDSHLRLAQLVAGAPGQWRRILECARGAGGPRVLSLDAPDVDDSVWPVLRRMRRLVVLEVHTKGNRLRLRPDVLGRLPFLTKLYWDTGARVRRLARQAGMLPRVRSMTLAGDECTWEETDGLKVWLQRKLGRRDAVELICKHRRGPYCYSPLSDGEDWCAYYQEDFPEVKGGYGWDQPFWTEMCLH